MTNKELSLLQSIITSINDIDHRSLTSLEVSIKNRIIKILENHKSNA